MIINYVKPSMIFGVALGGHSHRLRGGGGGGGGHDSLSCWFFYFEAV